MTKQAHPASKKVILDKSFLQAESKGGPRLLALVDKGYSFVITDTLVYELCSGKRSNEWPVAQGKLCVVLDHVEVWCHSAKSLALEIEQQKPVDSHVDTELTNRFQELLRTGEPQLIDGILNIIEDAKSRREVDSAKAAFKFCLAFSDLAPDVFKQLRKLASERGDVSAVVRHTIIDGRIIQLITEWSHGNSDVPENYIAVAEDGLTPDWFAYQNAKTMLAVAIDFCVRFSDLAEPPEDFKHTLLDADYLTLLHYADALATNETSGGMATLANWMYGDTKLLFSTLDVDSEACD